MKGLQELAMIHPWEKFPRLGKNVSRSIANDEAMKKKIVHACLCSFYMQYIRVLKLRSKLCFQICIVSYKERKVMLSRFLNFLNRRREKKNFSHGKTQTLISAFIRQVLHPVELCTGAFVFIYSSTFNLQEKCASSDKSTTYSESPGRTGKNVTLRSIASTWLRFLSSIEWPHDKFQDCFIKICARFWVRF